MPTMTDPVVSMALVTGLLGSGHCIGMCGGLVAGLGISRQGERGGLPFHLLYHTGRVATYILIGIIVGWIGSTMELTRTLHGASRVLLVLSDLFVILLGLGTAGLFSYWNLNRLEFPGPMKIMTGLLTRFRSLPPTLSALPLGLLMGWLPCGFLYAMVMTAAQSGHPLSGGAIMAAFGLGTTPALLGFGTAAHWLSSKARLWMVRGAGLMVAAIGLLHLIKHLRMFYGA
ncbi:sulfite exporter TauE/SafE family protein [Geothermobacter hydrogeniphilus]|nr:sulfite exporter TauE/SafE family protein [Geothermobacter hydrogeniphilus]